MDRNEGLFTELVCTEVSGLSMFAVRLIKRLTKSVVRHMPQGDNSPSINHGSFIILFNDSLCLCVEVGAWVKPVPLCVQHMERFMAKQF